MKKIKIVFLVRNNTQNIQINNIIKNINFKNLDIEIFYTQNKILEKKSFFFNILLKMIFFVEKKFLCKIELIKTNKKKNEN